MRPTQLILALFLLVSFAGCESTQTTKEEESPFSWRVQTCRFDSLMGAGADSSKHWFSVLRISSEIPVYPGDPEGDSITMSSIEFEVHAVLPGTGTPTAGCPATILINGASTNDVSNAPWEIVDSPTEASIEVSKKFHFQWNDLKVSTQSPSKGGICIILETIDPLGDPLPSVQSIDGISIVWGLGGGSEPNPISIISQNSPELPLTDYTPGTCQNCEPE